MRSKLGRSLRWKEWKNQSWRNSEEGREAGESVGWEIKMAAENHGYSQTRLLRDELYGR